MSAVKTPLAPPSPTAKAPDAVAGLFGRIAPWYDLLNHLLTLGIDRRWRARLARDLRLPPGSRVLDVACGTGDLTLALGRAGHRVVGLDFCRPMLERAHRKAPGLPVLQGDALALPFADGSVDAVSVAFGVRNFEHLDRGLTELCRVLRPGGRVAILEFGVPAMPVVRQAYLLYFRHVLPAIGRVVSGDATAYAYLRDSVLAFPKGAAFEEHLRRAGFEPEIDAPLTGGIVHLYVGRKAA